MQPAVSEPSSRANTNPGNLYIFDNSHLKLFNFNFILKKYILLKFFSFKMKKTINFEKLETVSVSSELANEFHLKRYHDALIEVVNSKVSLCQFNDLFL